MASRAELEQEWQDYQRWSKSQTLDFADYLEWRDLVIAKENLETLKNFIEGLEDDEVSVAEIKEILKHV